MAKAPVLKTGGRKPLQVRILCPPLEVRDMRSILGCTLLLAAFSMNCRTMKPVGVEHVNLLKPDRVWVTGVDESVVVLSSPHVVGDTLAGYVNGRHEQLLTSGLKEVKVRTSAPTRTALLAAAIAVGLGGVFIAVAAQDNTKYYRPLPCSESDPNC